MVCPSCGNELEEGLNFCPHCGEKVDPVEAMLKEADSTPAAGSENSNAPAPAAAASKDLSSGNAKRIAIAVGIIAVVIVALFAGRAMLNRMHERSYAAANKELAAGKYADALKRYSKLGDYEDAKKKATVCEHWIDYQAAEKLMKDGSYKKAQKAFEKLGGFEDSQEKATHCANMILYEQAEKLFEDEKYADAKEIYDQLPIDTDEGLTDAAEHLTYCNNSINYDAAESLLKEKKYYDAYTKYSACGDFKDAKEKINSCIQTFPDTGETYRNENYASQAVSLKIVPPSNDTFNYLKIYSGSDLVSCVAIGKNANTTISLPVGSYQIKNAYGSGEWFGADDMFGNNGTYIKLTNGSSDTFTLEANMIYTLTLRSSTATGGDSVGSQSENRADF